MKIRVRYVLLVVGLAGAVTLALKKPPEMSERRQPKYRRLSGAEFWQAVDKQAFIQKYNVDSLDAERAGLVAHLAKEGYRLGYMDGLQQGAQRPRKEVDSNAAHAVKFAKQ